MSILSLEFSPDSLREIARFAGIPALLAPQVQAAMDQGAEIIVAASQGNMHWKNPTGRLEASMHRIVQTPYSIIVGSDLPYARRRELGFSGTDSRGRTYNDKGAFFLTQAIEDNERTVLILLDDAVMSVVGGM